MSYVKMFSPVILYFIPKYYIKEKDGYRTLLTLQSYILTETTYSINIHTI